MNPERAESVEQSRSARPSRLSNDRLPRLPEQAHNVAICALREARLRGLPAAEEYRVVSDRLYRSGVRDLPPGLLVRWIEETVAAEYESFLELRALGDRVCSAIARNDIAAAVWELICILPADTRARLCEGAQHLAELEGNEQ